jgi:hypothetical protein
MSLKYVATAATATQAIWSASLKDKYPFATHAAISNDGDQEHE